MARHGSFLIFAFLACIIVFGIDFCNANDNIVRSAPFDGEIELLQEFRRCRAPYTVVHGTRQCTDLTKIRRSRVGQDLRDFRTKVQLET